MSARDSSHRYVVRGVWLSSQDPQVGEMRRADVLIEGSTIAAIAPDLGEVDAEEIDGTDRIMLPGFVDTHRHTWQSLIRHVSTDWTLPQYFSGVRGVLGREYAPEDMYAANLVGMLDALDSGITTVVDWSHNNNSPDHSDAAVQGLKDAGLRAVFGYGNSNQEWFPVSDKPSDPNKVYFGAWVTIEDEDGEQSRYRIVGPDELDLKQGLISIDSPLARALVGKELDAEVWVHSPSGEKTCYIVEIEYP